MTNADCIALLQWALPRLRLRWPGFRRVRSQVCKRVARRIAELGLPDPAAYRARLDADAAEWSVLGACCWITISRFYRDQRVFDWVTTDLLPALAQRARRDGRRTLRVWSAGCASGEEPYTLRIAWDLCTGQAFPDIKLEIVATDVCAASLARAERAVYSYSAVKGLPVQWRASAFDQIDGSYRLREAFRAGVEFRQEDVRRTMPSGRFDLILCRNLVFTYFDTRFQHEVLSSLVDRLLPHGALLVGASEATPRSASLVCSTEAAGLYRLANCNCPE